MPEEPKKPMDENIEEEQNRGIQPDTDFNQDEESISEQIPEDNLGGQAYTGGWDEARENPEGEALRNDSGEEPGTSDEYSEK